MTKLIITKSLPLPGKRTIKFEVTNQMCITNPTRKGIAKIIKKHGDFLPVATESEKSSQ